MFDDKLFEYLVATDQIDDVLGSKNKKEEKEVMKPKLSNNKKNEEIKGKKFIDKKSAYNIKSK